MWKMTQRFGRRPKYLGNGLDTWDTALVFEKKWLRYMGHGFSTALLCWKWLKNLTNGYNMWEMTYIFGKWLKYLRNG